jgi:competence protein ComEA
MSDTLPPPPRPRRLQLSLGAAVIVGLVVLSGAVGLGLLKGQSAPTESVAIAADADESAASGDLYVHVLGAVEHPGLYVLDLDSRMVDAVAAAGGTTDAADLAGINLARALEDGEQIIVPVAGVVDGGGDAVVAQPADDRVDLNAADQAALETLPRIGPALAERIIAWREENGGFQSVDDLLAVPGIGEKLLAGIREAVRV